MPSTKQIKKEKLTYFYLWEDEVGVLFPIPTIK